jgi:hypothetical protein
MGLVPNLNTSAYVDNDTLWYDPAGGGAMTATKPAAPNIKSEIGIVTNAGSGSSGSIYVKIFPGSQLGGTDQNVQLTSPTNNDFLVYDGGDKRWENYSASSAKTAIGLSNVENTALSTWAGSTNITTLGTISTGTVPAANVSGLATVATTGAYADLSGTPTLATVATSGKYSDLTGLPTLGTISSQDANNVTISGGSINGTTIGASSASTGAFTTLSASSTVSGTGFSDYLASPPAIGGTTPAAGKFTTLDATGNVGFDGGTFTFNEAGADKDFRIEGDSKTHLFFSDASVDRIGINQSTPLARLDLDGNYASNITAMGALDVDCSTANYFTKTINANSTFTFSNPPATRAFAFALELTHTSGTITWPTSVKWPKDTAPTLTTGKTHIFIFVTDDGGTRWRGASLVDYVN